MENKLEKVSTFSFPSNHLLNFQLMRDLEKSQSIKPEYFFFVSLTPGVQADGPSGRTYDFNSNVSLKYSVYEVAGLAFALKQYANGNGKFINYVKFTKSSTGQKTISLKEESKVQNTKSGDLTIRQIHFRVTNNNNTQSIAMTLDQAYAVAEMLEILYKKGAELEFNRQVNTVSYNNGNRQQTNKGFNQNKPSNDIPSNESPVITEDDNSNYLNSGFSGFGGNPFG